MSDNDYIEELLQLQALSLEELKADIVKKRKSKSPFTKNLDYLKTITLSEVLDDTITSAEKSVELAVEAATADVVRNNDSRLSDSRAPEEHTHTAEEITNLPDYTPAINAIDEALKGECEAIQKQFVAVKKEILDIANRKVEFPKVKDYAQNIKEIEGKFSEFVNKKEFEKLKKEISKDPNIRKLIGGGGYKEVRDEGVLLPLRHKLNFIGSGVAVTDNANTNSTDVTISSGGGTSAFTDLTDVPASYAGQSGKVAAVNAGETGLEFIAVGGTGTVTSASVVSANGFAGTVATAATTPAITLTTTVTGLLKGNGTAISAASAGTDYLTPTSDGSGLTNLTAANIAAGTAGINISGNAATVTTNANLTGHITSVGNAAVLGSFTKAQLDTAVSDGNVLYVGDITQYTDELAQDAVGAMVDSTLVYTDGTPLLSRAALTGAVTASAGSNATSLGSFTIAQLNTAVSDADVATLAGAESLTNKKLGSLTTNGFVKTSGGDGTLSVDTTTYQTQDATLTALAGLSTAANKIITVTGTDTFSTTDFKDVAEQTYSGTITWTGTTAPSGATTHRYVWSKSGKTVHLQIWLEYATNGSATSSVSMTLPTDCPAPFETAGLGAASERLYAGVGWIESTGTANPGAARAFMRVNSGDTGYELVLIAGSSNGNFAHINIHYTSAS